MKEGSIHAFIYCPEAVETARGGSAMTPLETFGLYFGVVAGMASLHGWWVTNVRGGQARDDVVAHLKTAGQAPQPLLRNVEVTAAIPPPQDRSGGERVLLGRNSLRRVMEPLADHIDRPVLVTPAVSLPRRLGRMLHKDPLKLLDARPVGEIQGPPEPGLTQVSLVHDGKLCVGWKPQDEVNRMLDLDYNPEATPSTAVDLSRTAGNERKILDVPARRSSIFNVHDRCRLRLTDQRLEFVDERYQRKSYEIRRDAIEWVRLLRDRELLEVATTDGRKKKLEANLRDLRQVKEQLVGI